MLDFAAAGIGFLSFVVSISLICGIAYLNADRLERWAKHHVGSKH